MDLRDYLRAVRKRWWLVVGATAVAVGVAVTVTLLTPPKYAASLTFFISTRGTEATQAFQGGQFAQQRVKSYVDVLTSNRLAQAVVARGAIPLDPETVQDEITAQVVPDTVLIEVTVTDPDRARTLQIAQSLAAHFPVLIGKIETPPGSRVPTVGVQVIAEPRLADDPVSPQPLRNLGLAVALGLIVGVGAAALRESLDTTIRSPESLTAAASAPTLSAIPFDGKADASPLITEGSAQSSRAEAMRQLRTNLQFVDVDRPLHSLVVSSAVPGEGKSTTVCNLGIAFAEAGKRVIIVDADLRRPMIAEYLGLEGAVGLTNVLAGQASVRDVVQPWGNNSLWVLPSGYIPPNPSELLGSDNMADLLSALSSGFDMIIIDTPPLLPVTDAAVMAAVADGCLLVSRHGKTTTTQVATAISALDAVGAKLHGCVLNRSPARRATAYSYYSYESVAQAKGHTKNAVQSRKATAPPAPSWPLTSPLRRPDVVATGRARPITGQPGWPEDFDSPTTVLRLPHTYQSDSALTTDLRELR
jgi:tyrosine-protein kinase